LYRKEEPKPDSGEVELGKRECKMNTLFAFSNFTIRKIPRDNSEIEFSLCNKIIRTAAQELSAAPAHEISYVTKGFSSFVFKFWMTFNLCGTIQLQQM